MANAAAGILAQLAGREGDVCLATGAVWRGCRRQVLDVVSSAVSHPA